MARVNIDAVTMSRAASRDPGTTRQKSSPRAAKRSNRGTVQRLTGVRVSGLPPTDPGSLAEAGGTLPIDDWQ